MNPDIERVQAPAEQPVPTQLRFSASVPQGLQFRFRAGSERIYTNTARGLRRLTPKPPSKKARRRQQPQTSA